MDMLDRQLGLPDHWLGTTRLVIGEREVPMSSRKSLAILAYLALQPTRSESRERLAALLWSDSGREHGRGGAAPDACGG